MPVYHIENSILGSFHQGSSQFGDTAGRQCACNSLFSILWSKVRNINLWTQHDLDEILIEGDKLYKSLNTQSYLSVDDLPSFIPINGSMANVHLLNLHTCEASLVTGSPFLRTPLQNCSNKQMLLFINGFTLAIFQSEYGDTCHLFDSHSKDEQGLSVSNGKSVLLTFANLIELEAYIQVLYLEYQSRETIYFQIQYVDFSIDDDTIQDLRATFRNTLRCKSRKVTRQEYYNKMRSDPNFKEKRKNIYEKDKEKRKQKYQNEKERRKQKYQNEKERRSQKYQEKKEKKKQNYQEEKEKLKQPRFSDNIYLNKEKLFKKQILSGPFYTCVCCHRCLYEHSVRKYCPKNYKFSVELYCKLVSSFDGFYYICRTCNDKFKKKKIPCQSVSNKLEIFELPHDLKHIRRLERVLIAKRIIFKKVTIMQKGQSPKVKGALCNVPVDYIDTTNILPRQADSNGIILVKLKRKLDYRGHVYFEGVRPNFIMRMLCHLRAWNHLYKDIEINIGNIPSDLVNLSENGSNNDPVAILQYLTRDISEPIDLLLESSAVTQPSTNNDIHEDSNLEFTEDPLNEYCTPADETVMMSNISKANDIDNEILNLAPGEGANPINILSDEYCEELAHPHLFPTGKFGYRVERKIPLTATKYFNQRLLNYTQRFASDSDYIFFANSVVQQLNLSNQMNIAMKKVSSTNLTAGMFSNNFKETVRQFVSNDKAFGFMSTIKGTPAYWKKFLQEVLAMVKQLGPPTFFLTLSCADLRWNDLVSIISKLKGSEMSDEKLNLLSYEERCRLLNSNPVLVARHFQYRVESFFKHILIDGPLGKTQYYATRVEFQVRGSPHIHCFLWTKDVPLMNGDKEAYIQHIDSKISAALPSESENKKMFDLVRVFQLHRHSKTCKKYRNKNCRFNFGKYFTENTIISEPLPKEMDYLEKKKIIQWCQEILEPVKKYINNELNPKNTNFFDKKAENFIQLPSIDDILSGLNISKVDYYKALSISTDEDYQIHLKRLPNSCFVNNYFTLGLSSWEANLDIQPVYNYYKAITYMCAYLSKTEDECSHAMNQAAQEAFLNNTDAYTKMKSIARAYTTKREVSVQEAVYLVMPELWLRKVFPGVLFANSNSPEKRYKVCLSEKEMSSLPDSSTAIFKRNMLDRYCDRPDNMFSSGRYEILNSFCFAEFLRYYSLKQNISNDCQPDELKNDIIEPNHPLTTYPTIVPLMNSSDKLRCRKVPLVLRYFEPNRDKHPEDYAHHLLFMFYPFREETELLSVDTKSHVGKLNEPGVLDVVNRNKQIIEPFSELVHDAFQNFIHDHVNETSFDPYAQQENEESYPDVNQEDTDNASSENVTNTSISSLILPDDDINAQIRSLNYQQKEVFDFVLQWAINFIKYVNCKLPIQIKPFNLFLTGGGGVGKSHLLTTIYNSVTKVLSYKNGHPDKKKILVLAPTGVASININGTTIHSGLSIPTKGKLYPLNDKNKTNLRMKLANVELIIIDEISMVSSMLFRNIDMRLQEIYLCDKPFGGKSIILCGDLYQLPPVQGKPVYTYDTTYMQGLLGLELWRSFVMAELTEVMRQKGNAMFINLLNQARLGTLDSEKLSVLKSRFISKNDKNYPSDIIHIYAENAPVDEHNSNMLDRLETPLILIQAIDQVPIDSELSNTDLSWVQNAKISETGGLLYSLRIKLGARVMITKNIDIDDKLINGQVGTIKYVQFVNNKVTAVFIQLDDETAGKKAMQSSNIGRSNSWVKVERAEAIFNTKRRFVNSPTIRRTQFPLMLSWACTCHKVQGLSLTSAVISFELFKQKQFNPGQMYVSLSRVTNLENLYLIGEYTENAIRINKKAETEYERLRHESLFIPFKNLNVSLDSLTITLLNVRSLSKHSSDIAADARLTATDIFCLTETQLLTESDVSVIETHLSDFKFEYNNCISHRFNSLAICYKKTSFIENCFKFSAISIIKFRKPSFSNEVVTLALIYRQPNHLSDNFLHRLSRILNDYDIDILLGDFNVDALDKCNTNLRNILQDYKLMNSEPTHLSGSLLDHVYLKKRLLDNKSVEVVTTNVFFSDHDAVTLKLSNN